MEPFRNFVNSINMIDLGFQGPPYTWTNNQQGADRIRSRLDRAMANVAWRLLHPMVKVFHEQDIGSDHKPIIIALRPNERITPAPFRFDERWCADAACSDIIHHAWETEGTVTDKLQRCQTQLAANARTLLSLKRDKEIGIKASLAILSDAYQSEEVTNEAKKLKAELEDIWKDDHTLWRQTAKENWLKNGDRNTKFFHAVTTFKQQRAAISRLQDGNGDWISDPPTLRLEAKQYFQTLFTARQSAGWQAEFDNLPSLVSEETNRALAATITNEEIRKAVFDLGASQSPGPDGFGGHFYRKFWHAVGNDVCTAVKAFFTTNEIPDNWNDTHLVLIPKVPTPTSMSQFRPISCCNFKYKIIAKVMATRIKPWMPGMISELQAAFTGGRLIQDNIVIVHEALHSLKLRKGGRRRDMCIKLDMRKAYDLVDWDCIDHTLTAYGFCPLWRGWVKACVRTVRFDVLFNGRPTGMFRPSRGIRQGDPLSPFLFILMSNALSIMIERKLSAGLIHGIRLSRTGPLLTHCLFADDTIIFGQATTTEASAISTLMEEYGTLTGQELNQEKSSIYFSANVPQETKDRIVDTLGFTNHDNHTAYLGVPTEWGRSKKETFGFLLDRLAAKASCWKCRLLSHAGKMTLIKGVLQAVPSYIMSLFLLPKYITKRMTSMIHNFFWGGSLTKKTIHWCKANILTSSKSEGGLGLRDIRDFNLALTAKQAWRLTTSPDALWARVLKGKYFPRTDFLHANKGGRSSWIWASLCESRSTLDLGAFIAVGNGESIELKKDPWIASNKHMRFPGFTGPFEYVADWISYPRGEWDTTTIEMYCGAETANAIRSIPIGPSSMPDSWMWKFTDNGEFTVKSAYHALRDNNDISPQSSMNDMDKQKWSWLWRLPLPPKILFFLWRCATGALATTLNLHRRQCSPDPFCPMCNLTDETLSHCLFHCPHSANLWSHALPTWPTPNPEADFLSWFVDTTRAENGPSPLRVAALCWNIWKARNKKVFNLITPSLAVTASSFEADFKDWSSPPLSATPSATLGPATHIPPSDVPLPREPHVDFHCDGSFTNDSQKAAYGIVISNSTGRIVDGRAGTFHCSSAIVAEAYAIKEATIVANQTPGPCRIFSDCKLLIDAISGPKHRWPWRCYALLGSIKELCSNAPHISFHFTPRVCNSRADSIAKSARLGTLLPGWVTSLL
ncbi:Putative ribonuclease H protein At1g65750 [Linum grandiflorum]